MARLISNTGGIVLTRAGARFDTDEKVVDDVTSDIRECIDKGLLRCIDDNEPADFGDESAGSSPLAQEAQDGTDADVIPTVEPAEQTPAGDNGTAAAAVTEEATAPTPALPLSVPEKEAKKVSRRGSSRRK